jgi:hypothetical protein
LPSCFHVSNPVGLYQEAGFAVSIKAKKLPRFYAPFTAFFHDLVFGTLAAESKAVGCRLDTRLFFGLSISSFPQTLPREHPDLDLRLIQPTAVGRHVMDSEPIPDFRRHFRAPARFPSGRSRRGWSHIGVQGGVRRNRSNGKPAALRRFPSTSAGLES